MTLPAELDRLSGKAAVFVRGFIEHVSRTNVQNRDIALRPTQAAGMSAVEELGDTISVPYVSKLTKLLETADVIYKNRKGKGYIVIPASNFTEMSDLLHNSGWGRTIEREASEDDIRMRSAILDHMNDVGHVRIEAENPIDKRAYQVLIDKFKQGQYDMVFVDRDIALEEPNLSGEHPETFPVRTLHASVENR